MARIVATREPQPSTTSGERLGRKVLIRRDNQFQSHYLLELDTYKFKTGIFLSRYPYQNGKDRLWLVFTASCKSSIADAYLMSVGSDHAVFIRASPNGIPVVGLTPAGSVIIGYPLRIFIRKNDRTALQQFTCLCSNLICLTDIWRNQQGIELPPVVLQCSIYTVFSCG